MSNDTIVISSDESKENRFIDKHRSNVKSDLIEITEDKLENILIKHIQRMELRKRWLIPCSFFVSVALTLSTATFKTTFGLEAPVWHAMFVLVSIGSGLWLSFDLIHLVNCWSKTTLSYLVGLIKNAQNDG